MSNHSTIQQQLQQQESSANIDNNNSTTASIIDLRQEQFDEFMAYFTELFGAELFNLHSMDASEEATRLLADCIEANWFIFNGGNSSSTSVANLEGVTSAIKQKMMMTNLKELSSSSGATTKPSQD